MGMQDTVSQTTSVSTNSTVKVRLATPDDVAHIERLHELINTAYRTTKSWTTEAHIVSGERITRDELRDRLITGKPPTFVAELISEDAATPPLIVGTVELAMDDDHGDVGSSSTDANDPPLPPHAILGLLAVDPAHQSRRIGSTLVKAAEAYARDTLQLQALVIWVINRRSEIINWYQRLGFKDTGRTIPFVWEDKLIDKNVYFRIFIKNLVD